MHTRQLNPHLQTLLKWVGQCLVVSEIAFASSEIASLLDMKVINRSGLLSKDAWHSEVTLHPQRLKLFWSLSRVPVCSQFGSQPTAQTVFLIWNTRQHLESESGELPNLKQKTTFRKWKWRAYLSAGGPKNLSNTGRTGAWGNKCGWYSFLICLK